MDEIDFRCVRPTRIGCGLQVIEVWSKRITSRRERLDRDLDRIGGVGSDRILLITVAGYCDRTCVRVDSSNNIFETLLGRRPLGYPFHAIDRGHHGAMYV